jgi:phosphoribosylformylglycinamidine (FGAM) synthase PurS component
LKVYIVLKVEVNAESIFGQDIPKQQILEVWKGDETLKAKIEEMAGKFLDNPEKYEIVIEEWEVKE